MATAHDSWVGLHLVMPMPESLAPWLPQALLGQWCHNACAVAVGQGGCSDTHLHSW